MTLIDLAWIILILAMLVAAYIYERDRKANALKSQNKWRYCPWCGDDLHEGDIDGKKRLKCMSCKFVHWDNPRPVAIVLVPTLDGGMILVRRKIPPREGMMALPGGFVEPYESPEAGAKREVKEETGLDVEIERLLFMTMPNGLNEILMFYLAKPTDQKPTADATEVSEVVVVDRKTLSVTELAFQTHRTAVEDWLSGEQY